MGHAFLEGYTEHAEPRELNLSECQTVMNSREASGGW